MITENYVLHSPKITCTTKIAFLSDLHGENPQGLERALDALAPDLIIVGGDLFDRRADNREALQLMEVITENCPCFYTPGNHELYVSDRKELYATLRNYGMTILDGKGMPFTTPAGQYLWISGISTSEQLDQLSQPPAEIFHILIYHYPEKAKACAGRFDLRLAGHEHGGIFRTKRINGLIGHSGLLPKFAGGYYDLEKGCMIVSRGLSKTCAGLPRLGNPPELVTIKLKPQQARKEADQ